MKFRKILPMILIDVYMIATALAQVSVIGDYEASLRFSTVGAFSQFLSLALFWGDEVNFLLGAFSGLWIFAFPVLLIIFYVMACKGKFIPFCVVISIDALISFSWLIDTLVHWDAYRFPYVAADGIVSVVYTAAVIISVWWREKGEGAELYPA